MRTGSAPPPTDTVSSLAGSSSSSSAVLTSSSSSGSSTSSKTASSSGSGGSSASGAMSPGSFGSVAAWFVLTVDSYLVGFLCRIWVHQTLQLANRGGGCRGVLASGRRELRAPLLAQGFLANAETLGWEARQRIPLEGAPHPSEDASHLLRRLGVTSDRVSARSGELLQVCLDERLGGRKAR